MQMQQQFFLRRLALTLGAFAYTLSALVSAAETKPGPIADAPLATQGGAPPNLMILLDASGSMDWGIGGKDDKDSPTRLSIVKTAATQLINDIPVDSMNVGLARFSGNFGTEIMYHLQNIGSSEKTNIIGKIDKYTAGGGTPLGAAVANIGHYFTGGLPEGRLLTTHPKASAVKDSVQNIFKGSLEFADSSGAAPSEVIKYYCQKNFLVALTDGEPTEDGTSSVYLKDYDRDGNEEGNDLLDDVALALYDIDLRPDLTDEIPVKNNEQTYNNVATYLVGFAGEGIEDNTLMESAARYGGGEYIYAENADELQNAFNKVLAAATAQSGSRTAAAFNAASLGAGGLVYLARFNSEHWSGELEAWSLEKNGEISTLQWKASEEIKNRSEPRKIITFDGNEGVNFDISLINTDGTKEPGPHEQDLKSGATGIDEVATKRLNYILGYDTEEGDSEGKFRERRGVDKEDGHSALGDIVHSAPVYLGPPKLPHTLKEIPKVYSDFVDTNQKRKPLVFVGANDGMLHAFNANTGTEVFAYIPKLLLSAENNEGLHYLTSQNYEHKYYVDLTVTTRDAKIGTEWHTVLAGGLGAGGKGYFFLDVTNPSSSNAKAIALGEYGADDKDMGYSFSRPKIAQFHNGEWGVVFGNGYNSENGKAMLYIYWLNNKPADQKVTKYAVSNGSEDSPQYKNGLSTPSLVDLDRDGKIDRVYAGDVKGNLWGFDLSTSDQVDSTEGYKLFTTDKGHAITQPPRIGLNTAVPQGKDPTVMVLFGSGQYLHANDLKERTASAYYGVWDNGEKRDLTSGNLAKRELITESVTLANEGGTTKLRKIEGEKVKWNVAEAGTQEEDYGWYIKLNEGSPEGAGKDEKVIGGERVIVESHLIDSVLFFNTAIPIVSPCSSGGTGWLMSVDFTTGMAPNDFAVFDANNDGIIDDADKGYAGEQLKDVNNASSTSSGDSDNTGILDSSGFISGDGSSGGGNSGGGGTGGNGNQITKEKSREINTNSRNNLNRLSWEELRY